MAGENGTVTSRSELFETLKKEASKYNNSELKVFIARYVLPPLRPGTKITRTYI
jgi:hypothetical protein